MGYTVQIPNHPHLTSSEVKYEVDEALRNHDVIPDACAKTIASWWHGPGTDGQNFSRLSHGVAFETEDLLRDIDRELNWTDPIERPQAVTELWALRAWVAHWTGDYRG